MPASPLAHGVMTAGAPLYVVAASSEAAEFDRELPVLITGVGKVAAAWALTRCLERYLASGGLPSVVVNIGTAGALRADTEGIHVVNTVLMHDFSHAPVRAITGFDVYPPIDLGPDCPAAAASETVLATGDLFVEDAAVRERLAAAAHLCDMEGYAVAHIARRYGVPVELIKHVSDTADADSQRRWVEDMPGIAAELAARAASR